MNLEDLEKLHQLKEKGIISEVYREVEIRKTSASAVRKIQSKFFV